LEAQASPVSVSSIAIQTNVDRSTVRERSLEGSDDDTANIRDIINHGMHAHRKVRSSPAHSLWTVMTPPNRHRARNAANPPLGSGVPGAVQISQTSIHQSGTTVAVLGVMKLRPLYESRDSSVKINSPNLHRLGGTTSACVAQSTRDLIKGKL
jgi:hypothetical protein